MLKIIKKICAIRYKQIKTFKGIPNENDKITYVIRFYPKEGLMSMLYKACCHIEYANNCGYNPYVDLKHFYSMYKVRGKNAWEFFFTQPLQISDKKNMKSKYIICDAGKPHSNIKLFKNYWAESFNNYEAKNLFIKKILG